MNREPIEKKRKSIEKKRKSISITITERCNLNCVYCYEHNKDLAILPIDTIKDFLIRETSNLVDFEEFEVDFHGGEPLMAFPQLKEVAEWIWSRDWPKPYICFATTNGTLVHGEIKEWFKKNSKRFWLGLSLDGTKEMHDMNRSNSYDDIDFAFFRETWPTQGVKATVSPLSIHHFADGVKHIIELGFPYSINLAYGMEWTDELLPVYRRELKKVADFYLENPELEIPKWIYGPITRIGSNSLRKPKEKETSKWCGTGTGMICLGSDGKTYPCHAFMPSCEAKEGDEVKNVIDFNNDTNFRDPACSDCVLEMGCPSCYGNNYIRTGTVYTRDKTFCKFRKIEAVAASYLFGMMMQEPHKYHAISNLEPSRKLSILEGIKIVQENLADEVENY